MTEQKATLIGVVYDYVEGALWAGLIAGLASFVVFVAPGISKAHQRSEAERRAAFERECEFYCKKWGFANGTRSYSSCVADLNRFRHSVLTQLAGDFF